MRFIDALPVIIGRFLGSTCVLSTFNCDQMVIGVGFLQVVPATYLPSRIILVPPPLS